MTNTVKNGFKTTLLSSVIAASTWGAVANADEIGPGPTVSLYGGYMYFDEEIDLDPTVFGGVGIGYRFDSPWELELRGNQMTADAKYNSVGEADVSQGTLNAIYHLDKGEKVQPYLMLGAGHQNVDSDNYLGDSNSTLLTAGAGLKFFATDKLSIRTDVNYISDIKDELNHAAMTLGLHYQFGDVKAAKKAMKGEPAPVEISDTDKDGVPNKFDRCPGTPMGTPIDANGCEIELDDDKDGVVNSRDKCPDTSAGAVVDANGCYIIITETKTIQLNVVFETGSFDINPSSYGDINKVADFMTQYPLTNVVLEGHTDDSGSAAFNLKLSKKRAESVANYLIKAKGIDATRVSSTGYGEERPLVPNDSAINKAKNRRVTAKVNAQVETIKK